MSLYLREDRKVNIATGSDPVLLVAMVTLMAFGITMIYSATRVALEGSGLDPNSLMRRQAIWAAGAILLFLAFSFIDFKELGHYSPLVYVLTIAALAAVFLFDPIKDNAHRWINLGFTTIQPSSFAKPAMAVVLASALSRSKRSEEVGEDGLPWSKIGRAFLILALPALLIWREPDLGTTTVFLFMTGMLIYAAGASIRQMMTLIAGSVGGIWFVLSSGVLSAYQAQRIKTFLNPDLDPLGAAYNIRQSLNAIGSGQFRGKGLFEGNLTDLQYVPEQESDFIFTAVGEQLGFIGGVTLLFLFGVVLWRLLVIAATVEDSFGGLLMVGVASIFGFQVFVNIGMTVGMLPVTGLPLPFMSAGGSELLAMGMSLGMANSVWARRPATQLKARRKSGQTGVGEVVKAGG